MTSNSFLIIIGPVLTLIFIVVTFSKSYKSRKRSAKTIYKLIDDLEKKYIY